MDLRTLPDGLNPEQRVNERRKRVEKTLDANLSHLTPIAANLGHADEKNCEQMVGHMPLPVGIAGPLSVRFGNKQKAEVFLPLATTECWSPINYRDWPMLDWGWVREVCEHGLDRALATGRWKALATSNFCGPQFRGMWRDIDWHRRLTSAIGKAAIAIPARGAAT
jgi:hypothetical protein